MLSSFYAGWVDQLLGGPIPPETKATCDDCAMLPQPGMEPGVILFHPETKCCTFQPPLANYRVGQILADDDPELAPGQKTVEDRVQRRLGVSPWGLHMPAAYHQRYKSNVNGFGRDLALLCPHHIAGRCGIWRYSPASCSTWFCKHDRGANGWMFWNATGELLREIDKKLGSWCALQLGIEAGPLDTSNEDPDPELWGEWAGREFEFYRLCADRVRPLSWDDIVQICGPNITALSAQVRERYARLTSHDDLARPLMGLVQIEGTASGKYRGVTYSPYDPLRISPDLVHVLPHFDGRPAGEVLEEIRIQRGVRLEPALVRKMADFRVLVENVP